MRRRLENGTEYSTEPPDEGDTGILNALSLAGNHHAHGQARNGALSNAPSIIDRYLMREIGLTLLATALVLLAMVLSHRLATTLSQVAKPVCWRAIPFSSSSGFGRSKF